MLGVFPESTDAKNEELGDFGDINCLHSSLSAGNLYVNCV